MRNVPRSAEYIVVGGGTAGAVVAANLVRRGREVLVVEAGPDPGPFGDPHWPEDLVDATRLPTSHDWGFNSGDTYSDRVIPFERAKVIGGCSTHNGAVQTWGHRADYDGWVQLGNEGWSTDELIPYFQRATEQLRVWTYRPEELTPWQSAWYQAAPSVGLPLLADLNGLDETVGFAPESVNIVGNVRWNTAFAYLDPLRGNPLLTIVGDALADTILVESGRATGVRFRHRGALQDVASENVILTAGTFGSPAILQRSGIGSAAALRALDIPVTLDLPGVGENLHDQPFLMMRWEGSDAMRAQMLAREAQGFTPDEQSMGKAASRFADGLFDIHLLPYSPTHLFGERTWHAGVGALCPKSRGRLLIGSRDPDALPDIDHGFLTDPEGHDIMVLSDGIAQLREMAATPALASLLRRELRPGGDIADPLQMRAFLEANPNSYWHPVGTCKMGPASDPMAVVDPRGQVHGVAGCYVADCAIMPFVPRATTAMPAVVIADRIADWL